MKHTRFEYIGPNGREITLYGEFEQSVQDDGQTLKVFGSEAAAGWRPIETAPDWETVILYHEYWAKTGVGYRVANTFEWMHPDTNTKISHPEKLRLWMPLPPAPGAEQ